MKALVTGASGFVGGVLVEKLLAGRWQVRGLVRSSSSLQRLERLGVEVCYGDLADLDSLKRAARGVDVIFHVAGRTDHWSTWRAYFEANVVGTRNVVEALLAAQVPRLIHFSSFTVYGRQTGLISEDRPRQKNGDLYATSKAEGEEVVEEYAQKHSFPFTVIRPGVVYGPYDPKWVPMVARNMLKGRMWVVGSGKRIVPVIYGEDLADFAIQAAGSDAARGETFNVLCGERVTWTEFLTTLADYLGAPLPKRHIPASLLYPIATMMEVVWKLVRAPKPPPTTRFGVRLYTSDWRYDIAKAQRLLGFRAKVLHKEGLRRTIDWMRQENPAAWLLSSDKLPAHATLRGSDHEPRQ
jgi:nucleoside-diphosphate-sugar epimerase